MGRSDIGRVKHQAAVRAWHKANREKLRAYNKSWRANNPEKARAYHKIWYANNREKAQAYSRATQLAVYGLSPEEYDNMLHLQGGVCEICHEEETLKNRGNTVTLSVDHDHSTGQVRGLLCSSCNKGLGFFRDSPELLIVAIDYIRRYGSGV